MTFSFIGTVVGWGKARIGTLLREQNRYARAIEASDDGFFDWAITPDTLYVSPRFLEIYGFEPDTRFAGREDLIARLPFLPEDRPVVQQAFADHLAGKTPRYSFEVRFVRHGETRWVQLAGKATRNRHGVAVRLTGTVRDVTDRRRAEEALRESEQRYELAMAASESGYWDWDVPTNSYVVSPRAYELSGYPAGTRWVDRDDYRANINMHPEDFVRWEAAREALFAGTGERLAMEVRYIVHGETRWHSLQAICRRDSAGHVVRWTGSTTDITARKLAEDGLKAMELELRRAQRLEALGTLAGGVAHDFNNILGAILGYGEMALRDAPEGSRMARDLDRILVAGDRARALVERLLVFSRSAVGERVPVHVEGVVREVLDLMRPKLAAGVVVDAMLRAGPASVLGDATQVHQVVANLAANAIQAMPDGGTLRLALDIERVEARRASAMGLRGDEDHVVLTVADTGVGMAPEVIDRIFDPFFTTKEVGSGVGLGLSLVHGIVSELKGAIRVESSPGHGSRFVVYLPRCEDASLPSGVQEAEAPRGAGQRVLVVDDEEPLVQLAARTLSELGYVPVGVTSSTAALALFRQDPECFDALITDERMPELSGSALIREVRGLRRSLPVLLMSGFLGGVDGYGQASPDRGASLGADEVLQKPVSLSDLASSLARVLRR